MERHIPYSRFVNGCGFLLVRYIRRKIVLVWSVGANKPVRYPEYGGYLFLRGSVMYYTFLSFSSCHRVWPSYRVCPLLGRSVKKSFTVVSQLCSNDVVITWLILLDSFRSAHLSSFLPGILSYSGLYKHLPLEGNVTNSKLFYLQAFFTLLLLFWSFPIPYIQDAFLNVPNSYWIGTTALLDVFLYKLYI